MQDSALRLGKLFENNRSGNPTGIYSVCCAHPMVISAALELARDHGPLAVIEATCNQVNKDGGYTSQRPAQFADKVKEMAHWIGLPENDLVLGGDHLGPQPWREMPADAAMAKAITMIEAYTKAGYGKLHLDCSMSCADDPPALDNKIIAERAARLAVAAEAAAGRASTKPVYVIGTEVPAPGGMGEGHAIVPTTRDSVVETWRAHEEAFERAGLKDAFGRVVAVVVQPGLDFGNEEVVCFEPAAAIGLVGAVLDLDRAVYEAHSTDYQQPRSYVDLVGMHFAILKVGPAATFALREAIYALELVARELPGWNEQCSVRSALEAAMLRDPRHWASHYKGKPERQAYLRHFSYSDRLRYYWTDPSVERAMSQLMVVLSDGRLPLTLISQYFPQHARSVSGGLILATAVSLIRASVQLALEPYAVACGSHVSAQAEG